MLIVVAMLALLIARATSVRWIYPRLAIGAFALGLLLDAHVPTYTGGGKRRIDSISRTGTNCKVVPFSRTLEKNALTLPYEPRKGTRPTLHWGQRKLLLSEIEFLTLHGGSNKTLVYVGAADGKHIPFLAELFPHIKLILYDARDFHPQTVQFAHDHPDRLEIRQQYFTDADVEEFADQQVLFVSDIRTMPEQIPGQPHRHPSEEDVIKDMRLQERWIRAMNPAAYMIKLRLPYEKKKITYLRGGIYFQVWAPVSSGETRLIGTLESGFDDQEYDVSWYENALYRFNTCTRMQKFEIPVMTKDIQAAEQMGLPHSYDLKAEQFILAEYLQSQEKQAPEKKVPEKKAIQEMLERIETLLGQSFVDKYRQKLRQEKMR